MGSSKAVAKTLVKWKLNPNIEAISNNFILNVLLTKP